MSNSLVSIVIPVYNGSNYLKEAIDSAIAQTYSNIEVLVINDGSNDNGKTEKIALSYGNKIRYFYKANGGVATAVNLGIKNMKGEYFAWLSHDDIYYPNKIEKQINALKNSGDMKAIVHSNFDIVDISTGKKTHMDWLEQYKEDRLTCSNFAPVFLCIHGCSILIHKSHFERVGLYDESLISTQDSEFLFKVMKNQKSIFVKDRLFMARLHPDQGSKTLTCHEKEYTDMFENFCKSLSKEEKELMCGSEQNFYYRLYKVVMLNSIGNNTLIYLKNKLMTAYNNKTNNEIQKLFEEEIFSTIGSAKNKEICLFGAGVFGKNTLNEFKNRNLEIGCFVDNSSSKIDTFIEGVPCISFEALRESKENKLVIISVKNSDSIEKQLEESEIPYIKWIDFNDVLFKLEPIKYDI